MPPAKQMSARLVSLPKAEIHIHLEGCFEQKEIARLAAEVNERLPRPLPELFRFQNLQDFLQFLDFVCGLVHTADQMAELARRFSRRMARSGVRYADAIINPTHWRHWRRRVPELLDALDAGFRAAEQDGLPPVGLCVSLLRTQSEEEAIELVEVLLSSRCRRVVALSIDGNEALGGRTGLRFAEAFRRAAAGGLKRTVHAGESSGPEGVWDAVELLGADRIDHGVRAVEDEKLMELLAARRIPLGICPTSNVTLGLFPSIADHPIDRLRRAGVPVSINTDDPALLQVSLEDEYERCAAAFSWSEEVLRDLARTSIAASFANEATRSRLLNELQGWRG
jgi:adenosine deaminase